MPRSTEFTRTRSVSGRARAASSHSDDSSEQHFDEIANEEPQGASYEESTDWGRIGIFAAGLAAGLTLGAGVALLLAPVTGAEAREYLGGRARALRGNVDGSWDDLRDELSRLSRRGRRKIGRGVTKGRWRVEDWRDG